MWKTYRFYRSRRCTGKCAEIGESFSIFYFCLCCCHHHLKINNANVQCKSTVWLENDSLSSVWIGRDIYLPWPWGKRCWRQCFPAPSVPAWMSYRFLGPQMTLVILYHPRPPQPHRTRKRLTLRKRSRWLRPFRIDAESWYQLSRRLGEKYSHCLRFTHN